MKVAICDYKEPLNRDLEIEKSVFKKFLGEDTEISLYVHEGDNEKFKEAIKDVDGILLGRELLQQGLDLFSKYDEDTKKEMVAFIYKNEMWFIDQVYQKKENKF